MKPTDGQIAAVVADFGMLKFFPSGEAERFAVMRLLDAMVSTEAELRWLRDAMVNRVGEWHGPADLRGVLCAYGVMNSKRGWQPADGIWAVSGAPGFTQDDRNARWEQQEGERLTGGSGALRLESGAALKLLGSPAELAVMKAETTAVKQVIESAAPRFALPEPTAEDREYSRRLLSGILKDRIGDDAA